MVHVKKSKIVKIGGKLVELGGETLYKATLGQEDKCHILSHMWILALNILICISNLECL